MFTVKVVRCKTIPVSRGKDQFEVLSRRKSIYETVHPMVKRGMRNGQTAKTTDSASLEAPFGFQRRSSANRQSRRLASFSRVERPFFRVPAAGWGLIPVGAPFAKYGVLSHFGDGSRIVPLTLKNLTMIKTVSIHDVISRLEARGYGVKQSGKIYRSPCPAHDGKDYNLAFTEGNKGQVLFTCHSHHCSYYDIMKSLGFEKENPTEKKSASKATSYGGKTIHATFETAVAAAAFGAKIEKAPDAVYRYDNADGTENFSIVRWNTDSGKITRPVSKIDGGYVAGAKSDGGYPIYRLPQMSEYLKSREKTARIYVCEGEKATDAAASCGLPATTSAFGSQSAGKTHWSVLDRIAVERNLKLEIVILPDNDMPGQQYADSLVEIFSKFKCGPTIKTVSLADYGHITGFDVFPDGGDFYDLCERLDSKTDGEIRDMIEKMAEAAQPETEIDEDEPDAVYPWRPFPVDLLPETVSKFVNEVSQANGCDPAGVAIATLVALATAIGNSRRLRLKRGWVFPAILWGMLIARKGSIKSWALAPAIKPLDERQHEYHNQYGIEKAEYNRKKAEYMVLSTSQRRKESPFDLKEPVLKRIVSRESTDQKVVKNCSENPRGFCIFSDELATLLQGMGQYCKDAKGGNAQSIFNSLFNGEALESERIGESRFAPHAFVCILGGIQPSIARQCFDKQAFESGFASRFIPVAPPPRVAKWSDATVSPETEENYARLLFAILSLEMEQVSSSAGGGVSEWNPTATPRYRLPTPRPNRSASGRS